MKDLIFICFLLIGIHSHSQNTLIPDSNFEQALIDLGYDIGIPDGSVPTSNIDTVVGLALYGMGINDLTGIQDFASLTWLYCENNFLTSLDVSQNSLLTQLFCDFNSLTSLDVSLNSELTWLLCHNNELKCLNIKNGNNLNMYIMTASNNPDLYCITVDSVEWSSTYWTVGGNNIDQQTVFSTNCENQCALSIDESKDPFEKQLIKIVDVTGRNTEDKPNSLLIYIYSDGTAVRVFRVE